MSLYLRAGSMRLQASVCSQPLPPHPIESAPSLGSQDSKWVFPGTGSISPPDAIPRFVPHFTQRRLRTRVRPHFRSDPGSGLLSTLEQALGTGHVPAGPPQVRVLCSSQPLRNCPSGPPATGPPRNLLSYPPASQHPTVHTSLASFLVSRPPSLHPLS